MEHVGMDLGKRESQIAIITEAVELIEKRVRTERGRLRQFFGDRPQARILMESSTISEWVARLLEEVGHEVVVADPNFAPMYAQRSRRVKTDKRDAQALAEACRLGAYRPAHRTSDEQRHVRALLAVRESLVRARVRFVTLVQAVLSREGFRVPTGTTKCFSVRVKNLELPEHLVVEITPLLSMFEPMNEQIQALDGRLGEIARKGARVRRVMTMPQIGPVTAVSFVGDSGRCRAFPWGAPGGGVPGTGATGVELGRDAAARADHQGGQREDAVAAGGGSVACGHAQEEARDRGSSQLGGSNRPAARQAGSHGGPGTEAEWDSLRAVEGWLGLRPGQLSGVHRRAAEKAA